MNKLHRSMTAMACLLAALCMRANAKADHKQIDAEADRIFRSACSYLADAKSFCVKVEVWKDEVLPSGVKIQTTRTLEVQERRPNQLHIEVRSPRVSRGFWLDGKRLTMLDRGTNLYGVMEVPDGIDKAVDAVEDRFGIEIPLCDVLISDPYQNLMENMETASDLGEVQVLGVACNHLLFTGPNADCQIWIAKGPRPLPRKIVINFKATTGTTQLTQIFSGWDLVTPIAPSVFTFQPPDGASKITVNPRKPEEASDEAPAASPADDQKK